MDCFKPNNDDRYADTNCNGVSGVDEFDIPLESKYCSNSYEAKGVAVLGDSASAHFGIPVRWMRPAEFNGKIEFSVWSTYKLSVPQILTLFPSLGC